jgi:5-methyltetrahydropteroyltriglutamate--homocysteine methyltransferase
MIDLHADIIGSLLRPPELFDDPKQFAAGTTSLAEFKEIEDRTVDEAIALQESVGLLVPPT